MSSQERALVDGKVKRVKKELKERKSLESSPFEILQNLIPEFSTQILRSLSDSLEAIFNDPQSPRLVVNYALAFLVFVEERPVNDGDSPLVAAMGDSQDFVRALFARTGRDDAGEFVVKFHELLTHFIARVPRLVVEVAMKKETYEALLHGLTRSSPPPPKEVQYFFTRLFVIDQALADKMFWDVWGVWRQLPAAVVVDLVYGSRQMRENVQLDALVSWMVQLPEIVMEDFQTAHRAYPDLWNQPEVMELGGKIVDPTMEHAKWLVKQPAHGFALEGLPLKRVEAEIIARPTEVPMLVHAVSFVPAAALQRQTTDGVFQAAVSRDGVSACVGIFALRKLQQGGLRVPNWQAYRLAGEVTNAQRDKQWRAKAKEIVDQIEPDDILDRLRIVEAEVRRRDDRLDLGEVEEMLALFLRDIGVFAEPRGPGSARSPRSARSARSPRSS